jgi:hypothetical protein
MTPRVANGCKFFTTQKKKKILHSFYSSWAIRSLAYIMSHDSRYTTRIGIQLYRGYFFRVPPSSPLLSSSTSSECKNVRVVQVVLLTELRFNYWSYWSRDRINRPRSSTRKGVINPVYSYNDSSCLNRTTFQLLKLLITWSITSVLEK